MGGLVVCRLLIYNENGGAIESAIPKIIESFIGFFEGIRGDVGVDRDLWCKIEKLLGILAREICH